MYKNFKYLHFCFFSHFLYYLSPLPAEKFKLISKTLNIKGHIFLAVLQSIFKRLNRHIDILTFVYWHNVI